MRVLLYSAVLVVVAAGSMEAQVCVGEAPLNSASMRVTGSGQFTDGVKGFGGSFTASGAAAFGGIGLGFLTYDEFDGTTTALSVGAGYEVPLGAAQTVRLCPVVAASYGFGPNDIEGSGTDLSSYDVQFGVSIGTLIQSSPQLAIVPAGGLSFAYSSATFEDDVGELEIDDSFGIASLGIGFVLGQLTIQPAVSMPFGLDESDPVFSLSFTMGFGRRP